MYASLPYALEVWRKHTLAVVNQTVPFCSGVEACEDVLANWITPASEPIAGMLAWRLGCTANVRVPDFFNTSNIGNWSEHTTMASDGHRIFTTSVCTCNVQYGFELGGECSPNALGVVNQVVYTLVVIWIFYVTLWGLAKLASGHFKSRRKKKLAIIAIVELLSQVISTTGFWEVVSIAGPNVHFRQAQFHIGLIAVLVSAITLDCEMTLNLSDVVSEGATEVSIKCHLKWIAHTCRVAPMVVGLAVVASIVRLTPGPRIVLGIVMVGFVVFLTIAFGYCIRVLDQRVLRLLPRDVLAEKTRSEASMHRSSCCFASTRLLATFRTRKVAVQREVVGETSALLSASKRLRRMALLQRRRNLFCLLTGVPNLINFTIREYHFTEPFMFVMWQIAMARLAMLGFGDEARVDLSPTRAMRLLLGFNVRATYADTGTTGAAVAIDDDESTDVGTLGS
jgi:hypothetical protein